MPGKQRFLVIFITIISIVTFHSSASAQDENPNGPYYIVQEGDSLWQIAARFGVTLEDLMKENNMSDASQVNVGTKLIIPGLQRVEGQLTTVTVAYGYYDDEAKQAVRDCGFNSARVVTDGPDSIPAGDPFALQAMPYIVNDTKFSKMFRYVTQTEIEGGGWVIFVFHHVCDNCDKFSVDLETFSKFAAWLGSQQVNNGLIIKTVDEVVGGEAQAGVLY
jgi:hypothetical protein